MSIDAQQKENEAIYIQQMFSEYSYIYTLSAAALYFGNKLIWEPEYLKFEKKPKALTGGGFTGGEREAV